MPLNHPDHEAVVKASKSTPIVRVSLVRTKTGDVVLKLQSDIFPLASTRVPSNDTTTRVYSDRLPVYRTVETYYPGFLNWDSPSSDLWLLTLQRLDQGVEITIVESRPISANLARLWVDGFATTVKEYYLANVCSFAFTSNVSITVASTMGIQANV